MIYMLLPVIVVAVYIGNVLGCLMLCETIPELNGAKKLVWQIPIINLSYVMYVLFSPKEKDGRFQTLLSYLKIPSKNALVTYVVAGTVKELAAEEEKSDSQQSSRHVAQRFFKNSIEEYGRAIIARIPYM